MENVTSLVTTNFGEKHISIATQFVNRVIKMLEAEQLETKTYAIDTASYGGEQELITCNLGDKIKIQITVTTRSS